MDKQRFPGTAANSTPRAELELLLLVFASFCSAAAAAHRDRSEGGAGRAAHEGNKKIPSFIICLDKTGERCCAVT